MHDIEFQEKWTANIQLRYPFWKLKKKMMERWWSIMMNPIEVSWKLARISAKIKFNIVNALDRKIEVMGMKFVFQEGINFDHMKINLYPDCGQSLLAVGNQMVFSMGKRKFLLKKFNQLWDYILTPKGIVYQHKIF